MVRSQFNALGINDLLTATGLSRASSYTTFEDKERRFVACLHCYVLTLGDASQAAVNRPGPDLRAQVEAGFDAVLDRMADPTQLAGCLLAQTAAESGDLVPSVRAANSELLEIQEAQMRRLLRAHLLVTRTSKADCSSLASFLVTVAQALAVLNRAGGSVEDLCGNQARHARTGLIDLDADSYGR